MFPVITLLLGFVAGAICMAVILMERHRRMKQRVALADEQMRFTQEALTGLATKKTEFQEQIAAKRQELDQLVRKREAESDERRKEILNAEAAKRQEIEQLVRTREAELEARLKEILRTEAVKRQELEQLSSQCDAAIRTRRDQVEAMARQLMQRQEEFEKQVISYRELQQENAILKRDLQNIDVNVNKLHLDGELRQDRQHKLEERSASLGKRYLNETVKSMIASVGPNNFSACKQRLLDVISWCREIGFDVSAQEEARLLADLKAEFEKAVKAQFEREEQARIKAQIREEQKLQREVDRELKQLERERAAIQAALDQALAEAHNRHTEEVERLTARLAEVEAKSQRAVSLAQTTKAGNVYVISNLGSFGEGVFKIGMTRRLEPLDRVRELGDASVPFPFDVHMMISCTDAPALENALHRELHKLRMNKTNPRKEFFKVDIDTICRIVREHHGEVQYVADPEALEYRQSLSMSEADSEYIESVYDAADDEAEPVQDDA